MFQFSLRTLLVLGVVVAVGCAALTHPTKVWCNAIVTLMFFSLLLSTIAALFGQGRVRTSAGGFGVAAWLYFMVVFSSFFTIEEHLLTTQALGPLERVMARSPEESAGSPRLAMTPEEFVGIPGLTIRHFHVIGQTLWTMLAGIAGSFLAVWFSGRTDAKSSDGG